MKLQISQVTKHYKHKTAVYGFTTELTPGIYGLIGPNGAGKTTLMRMIAQVSRPSSGSLSLNGRDIFSLGASYRDLIGYLPQDCGFYSYFSAERFLHYMAALKGLSRKQAKARTAQLLHEVHLYEERKSKLGTFSGGMLRRIGIAQALLNDPDLLILDEPTAGLDPKERVRFRKMLSALSGQRIILLSTHIISDIEAIAKEVLLIKQGELLRQERPGTILQELASKVWTVRLNESDTATLLHLESRYIVGNLLHQTDGIEARVIAEDRPTPDAQLTTPRLEDIYLYYFGGTQGGQVDGHTDPR